MASNAHQIPAQQKREDVEGYNIPNVIRDDRVNINIPGFSVHQPANGKPGSAVIDGTTYYPKPTARDSAGVKTIGTAHGIETIVIDGKTLAIPTQTVPAGYKGKLPGAVIGDKTVTFPVVTATPAARATPAPARRQADPTTTWANGIETIIYDGQTIALPNVTISGTETPTSLPAATIGDKTFTFPTVTADPNAPAPTLSLSSVSGIPLPPSVSFTPLAPLPTLTPLSAPAAPSITPLNNGNDAPAGVMLPGPDGTVTTLSLSSVSGIPLPPTTATIPDMPVARSSIANAAFKSVVPGITSAAALAGATVSPLAERYFSVGPDGVHTGDGSGSGSSDVISTDNWDHLSTAQRLVIIIVSAVVGVLLIGGIAALVICCRRRRSASRYDNNRYAAEEGAYWKEGAGQPAAGAGYGYSQPRPPAQAQQNPFADPRR